MTNQQPCLHGHSYICPHCNIYAQMTWEVLVVSHPSVHMARCTLCEKITLWHNQVLVYPHFGLVPPPHSMMPDIVLLYYNHARSVATSSVIAACAFLRLALQQLFQVLGVSGVNFNEDIDYLIKKGMGNRKFWQPLVHIGLAGHHTIIPGHICLDDDESMMHFLFFFINQIVVETIANPVIISQFCANLCKKRDKKVNNLDDNFFERL